MTLGSSGSIARAWFSQSIALSALAHRRKSTGAELGRPRAGMLAKRVLRAPQAELAVFFGLFGPTKLFEQTMNQQGCLRVVWLSFHGTDEQFHRPLQVPFGDRNGRIQDMRRNCLGPN